MSIRSKKRRKRKRRIDRFCKAMLPAIADGFLELAFSEPMFPGLIYKTTP